jgi:hypothetical protein
MSLAYLDGVGTGSLVLAFVVEKLSNIVNISTISILSQFGVKIPYSVWHGFMTVFVDFV